MSISKKEKVLSILSAIKPIDIAEINSNAKSMAAFNAARKRASEILKEKKAPRYPFGLVIEKTHNMIHPSLLLRR